MYYFRIFIISITIFTFSLIPSKVNAQDNNLFKRDNNISTWLWDTQKIEKDPDTILEFLKNNNVKYLYLQINYNVKKDVYRSFISKAAETQINVLALEGSPDWTKANGDLAQKRFFDWLNDYQSTSQTAELFRGVHLDVEPYLNNEYKKDINKVLQKYQQCILSSIHKSIKLNLPISLDIPFWFNEVNFNTIYGKGILAEWIFNNIKDVNIMAYRDKALGANGINKISEGEIKLANKYGTKVTIALETNRLEEGSYLSFYGEGQQEMLAQMAKVYDNYSGNNAFNGFAIHDLISWMSLK